MGRGQNVWKKRKAEEAAQQNEKKIKLQEAVPVFLKEQLPENGIVSLIQECVGKCIACKTCMWAPPFVVELKDPEETLYECAHCDHAEPAPVKQYPQIFCSYKCYRKNHHAFEEVCASTTHEGKEDAIIMIDDDECNGCGSRVMSAYRVIISKRF